jgi:hypothetical protein
MKSTVSSVSPPPIYPHKVPASRPPPPSYETAIASKPTSPTSLVSGTGLHRISAAANGTGTSAFLNLNPRNSVPFSRTSPPAPTSYRTSPSPTSGASGPLLKAEADRPTIRLKKDLENKENERQIRKITIVEGRFFTYLLTYSLTY